MKVITARIPDEDAAMLERIEQEDRTDRASVVRKLLARGIAEWRMERALERLRRRQLTLRGAARLAGVAYVEMFDAARQAGIDTGYTLADLERERERDA